MKVLLASLECGPPTFSGNGTYSRVLLRALLQHGCTVTVITTHHDPTLGYDQDTTTTTTTTTTSGSGQGVHTHGIQCCPGADVLGMAEEGETGAIPSYPVSIKRDHETRHVLFTELYPNSSSSTSTSSDIRSKNASTCGSGGVDEEQLDVVSVAVPSWGRVDRHSAWCHFLTGAHHVLGCPRDIATTTTSSSSGSGGGGGEGERERGGIDMSTYDIRIGVDWTGCLALSIPRRSVDKGEDRTWPPLLYMVFRLFTFSPGYDDNDRMFYRLYEGHAYMQASTVLTLCPMEEALLHQLLSASPSSSGGSGGNGDKDRNTMIANNDNDTDDDDGSSSSSRGIRDKRTGVLLPPLRRDIEERAVAAISPSPREYDNDNDNDDDDDDGDDDGGDDDGPGPRRYLLCCVRLQEEKGPHLFVHLVRTLAPFLRQHRIIPYLCGAGESVYAQDVRSQLRSIDIPCIVRDSSLSSEELCRVFQRTVLNVHTAVYEPYGMTIVEAAAFAAPSVVHHQDIGALSLLSPQKEQIYTLDFSTTTTTTTTTTTSTTTTTTTTTTTPDMKPLAHAVRSIILAEGKQQCRDTGRRAQKQALTYTEPVHARMFMRHMQDTLRTSQASSSRSRRRSGSRSDSK